MPVCQLRLKLKVNLRIIQTLQGYPPYLKPLRVEPDLTADGHIIFLCGKQRLNHAEFAESLILEFFEGLE
jgi:hypothetical protein